MEIHSSEDNAAYLKRRKIFSLISIAVFIAAFSIVTVILWQPLMQTFQNPEQFRAWIDSSGISGRLAFIGIDVLQVIFAIIPGEPVELAAGYAFSTLEGTVLCLIGDAIGTMVIFLFTKLIGIRMVEVFLSKEKINSLKFLHNSKNLNLLIFLFFFIPGTPKDIITYMIGLTPMKLKTLLILTSIARIPSVLTSTITGDALGVQDYRAAVLVYALTGVVSLAGIFLYRRITKDLQKENSNEIQRMDRDPRQNGLPGQQIEIPIKAKNSEESEQTD